MELRNCPTCQLPAVMPDGTCSRCPGRPAVLARLVPQAVVAEEVSGLPAECEECTQPSCAGCTRVRP